MSDWWMNGVADVCAPFQMDLSCLIDGELEEAAGVRAMAHLEHCDSCKEFFEDTRLQLQLHRDMLDPTPLAERFALLVGSERDDALETDELVRRLATIFYQVGKAYVLLATRPERMQVFEEAVRVDATRALGRGFVDGVVARGQGDAGGVDWRTARGLLNGRLSDIEDPFDKGLRLLEEALEIDASHEEARIWFGFAQQHLEKPLRAQREFERVFRDALDEINRGHAAVQLSGLYAREGEYRRALVYLRWVTLAGLPELDERFFVVRFNVGLYYAHLGQKDRSVAAFRELLDRHPESVGEVAGFFANSPKLRSLIDSQPGFAESLLATCPELFGLEPAQGGEAHQ